ncbi:GFA family protein [Streptomyces antnestii]|uniref:GFA family protein n=1 Tax=Streptomyces antnestii TaxID=2494256 RepID=UPI001CB8A1F4|nr:GFA family protein [Streptomyces sp. San01]
MKTETAQVRADEKRSWHSGKCHCGAVTFDVLLTSHLTVSLCNCDICFKSGFQEILVTEDRFRITKGQGHLEPYKFGESASHTFCKTCHILPFYRPRSHPTGYYSVNARCMDDLSFAEVKYHDFDGQNWAASLAAGLQAFTE